MTSPSLRYSIQLPQHVTALSSRSVDGYLCVGSNDGIVRVYLPPDIKVLKAVRGLGDEVSSVAWSNKSPKSGGMGHIYVAVGGQIMDLDLDVEKMILSPSDAAQVFQVGEDCDDAVNEVMLQSNGKYLAFSTDSGAVGIIELSTKKISRMKTRHNTVCGTLKFVPNRPSELVSGGYDSAVLHFDFNQGATLSRHDFTAPVQSSGVALSPPFVLSSAMSDTALLAIGTADGRLWIGGGGEKIPDVNTKRKRSRKWEGLKDEESVETKIAEGPVVAVAFVDPTRLVSCTLLGVISLHFIRRNQEQKLETETVWTGQTNSIAKVNAMASHAGRISIGGFDKDGKGVVETWQVELDSHTFR